MGARVDSRVRGRICAYVYENVSMGMDMCTYGYNGIWCMDGIKEMRYVVWNMMYHSVHMVYGAHSIMHGVYVMVCVM
ncbi:hypothetical protein EON63_23990 [archaeon]|nr:MAG: hypothetical protein EON63_23990 [archaeon]